MKCSLPAEGLRDTVMAGLIKKLQIHADRQYRRSLSPRNNRRVYFLYASHPFVRQFCNHTL